MSLELYNVSDNLLHNAPVLLALSGFKYDLSCLKLGGSDVFNVLQGP